MISVSESIVIDADRERVFEYLDDPTNHREITPSLVRVENITPLENGGKELEHTYKLGGVELAGTLHQTVHDPPSRMTFDMEGRLEGEIDITLEAHDSGTVVTYSAGYDLPGSVLERLADPFVRRYNERELNTTLENLRTRLETR
ncbi:MAG: SRPBCC family protein [Salinarchaeum sp.]